MLSILFLHENICCGYSLEAPRQGASNEYHNICFCREIRKILCGYPLLSVAMYLNRFVFIMEKKKDTAVSTLFWFKQVFYLELYIIPTLRKHAYSNI